MEIHICIDYKCLKHLLLLARTRLFFNFFLYFSALTLKSYYPLNFNWKMCLIGRLQRLARNTTFSENYKSWVWHNGTHAFNTVPVRTEDRDDSLTVMHQRFLSDKLLNIMRRTYGGKYGYITVPKSQNFKVTASGPADTKRVLMKLKAIDDNDRSKDITMELNHTGKKICTV